MSDLEQFCREFIQAQRISCAEAVYQTDRVIENAYEFIEGICDRVGYYDYDIGKVTRDTDGSPEGPDPQGLDGEAATAGAEGIAQPTASETP
jgi:hypothetical protein